MIRKSNIINRHSDKNEIALQKARDQIDAEIRKEYEKCNSDKIVVNLSWLNSDQLVDQLKCEYENPDYGEWKVKIDSGTSKFKDDVSWCNLILY